MRARGSQHEIEVSREASARQQPDAYLGCVLADLTQVAAAIFNYPCFEVQLLLLQPQQLQLLLLQQRLLLFKILRAWCPVVVDLLAGR